MAGNDDRGSGNDRRTKLLRMALSVAETLVSTLVVFALLQTFVARTYAVEQTSMEPTLEPAQRVIIDQLTPRFDPYKPGDIVIFDEPGHRAGQPPLIKRVIATAGSVVELREGRVYVDGVALQEPYTYAGEPTMPSSGQSRWSVGPGSLFVLGDHRAVSMDSRAFGPIPVTSVIGRAWLRFLPLDDATLLTPRH